MSLPPQNIGAPVAGEFDKALPKAGFVVVAMFVLNMMSVIDRNILAVLIPEIRADMHLDDFQISLMSGLAFAIFYSVVGLFIGGLIDSRPRRTLIYLGASLWSIAATATGLAANYVQMFLARMMVGVGEATIYPAAQSLMSDFFPRHRLSVAIASVIVSGAVGAGLSLSLGGWLLDYFTRTGGPIGGLPPWRQVMVVTALPGLALAFLVFTFAEPPRRGVREKSSLDFRGFAHIVIRDRRLLVNLLLAIDFGSIAATIIQQWVPTYARRVLGMSATEIGGSLGLIFLIGAPISMFAMAYACDRLFARGVRDAALRIWLFGLLASVPLSTVAFLIDNKTLVLLSATITQCTLGAAFGPAFAAIQMVAEPRARGRMAALLLLSTTLFTFAFAPSAIGFMTEHVYGGPEQIGLSLATAFAISGSFSIFFLWRAWQPFRDHLQPAEPRAA